MKKNKKKKQSVFLNARNCVSIANTFSWIITMRASKYLSISSLCAQCNNVSAMSWSTTTIMLYETWDADGDHDDDYDDAGAEGKVM